MEPAPGWWSFKKKEKEKEEALSCDGTPEFILTIMLMVRMNSGVPLHDNATMLSYVSK